MPNNFPGIRFLMLVAILIFTGTSQLLSEDDDKLDPLQEPIIPFAPKNYICYKADAPLVIDGKLTESAWQAAPHSDPFADIEGPSKPLPHYRTTVQMLWDEHYFYFGATLEEPHVWAKLTQRDTVIFYDNDFEIFIDPDGDTHHYYELEMNAFGTEWDLFLDQPYRDDGVALHAWDIAGLKTAVHIDGTINDPSDKDKGWTVEVAIPWHILKEASHKKETPPQHGDQWRANFSRVQWQTETSTGTYQKTINPETGKSFPESNWVWSPQGVINMHYPEMWGFVQFSENGPADGKDVFQPASEEAIKWTLRQIYYRQRNHIVEHGNYTDQIEKLNIPQPDNPDIQWPPTIQVTSNLYEATITSKNGLIMWTITQDGRIKMSR